jgi:hypothetical protein
MSMFSIYVFQSILQSFKEHLKNFNSVFDRVVVVGETISIMVVLVEQIT